MPVRCYTPDHAFQDPRDPQSAFAVEDRRFQKSRALGRKFLRPAIITNCRQPKNAAADRISLRRRFRMRSCASLAGQGAKHISKREHRRGYIDGPGYPVRTVLFSRNIPHDVTLTAYE